ncbi:MAG: hypothetical protein ACLGIA_01135 [Actinomycetes bacterium]
MRARKAALTLAVAGSLAITAGTVSQALAGDANTAAAKVQQATLELQPSSPALAKCFPHAKAKVTVALLTDSIGKDVFKIEASGLRPKTDYTVFLLEKAGAPFGAAEYIGDFTTDTWGRAENTFTLIVEEAFAFNNETGARKELNSVGFWFADQKDDDGCLGANSPVTGFDGDGQAGVQMMNSGKVFLP